jgi:hypothetical protein
MISSLILQQRVSPKGSSIRIQVTPNRILKTLGKFAIWIKESLLYWLITFVMAILHRAITDAFKHEFTPLFFTSPK